MFLFIAGFVVGAGIMATLLLVAQRSPKVDCYGEQIEELK